MDQGHKQKQIDSGGFRCLECGKLLARAHDDGAYKIKCTRCGLINSIFNGFTDQVIITDVNGIILYANSVVDLTTGDILSEVLGNKPSLWGNQMPPEFYKDMWRIIKDEKRSTQVIVTNKRKDGTLYKATLHISPVFGVDNEIKMFVGIESVIE